MQTTNTNFVPFHKAYVGKEEEEAVIEVLRSGWLTTGSKVAEFEKDFATSTGAKHAIAVSSATAGLFLSLKAIGIDNLSYVATTPYTFISTAEVAEWCGTTPIFCDIDKETNNIDVSKMPSTKFQAIIPVHIAGVRCDMEALYEKYPDSAIIEDCAHYFPSKFDPRSTTAVYSFYATKSITTGEGGMVVTNNDEIASRIRRLANHGIAQTTYDRYTSEKNKWYYEVHELGYKYNMAEIPAALGIVQLKKANEMMLKRTLIAKLYNEDFNSGAYDFIRTPVDRPDNTWHLYIVKLNLDKLTINRDTFIEELAKEGVGASVHFIPLHLMPYYKKRFMLYYPMAEKVFKEAISLPIFPGMDDDQIYKVMEAVLHIGERFHK